MFRVKIQMFYANICGSVLPYILGSNISTSMNTAHGFHTYKIFFGKHHAFPLLLLRNTFKFVLGLFQILTKADVYTFRQPRFLQSFVMNSYLSLCFFCPATMTTQRNNLFRTTALAGLTFMTHATLNTENRTS